MGVDEDTFDYPYSGECGKTRPVANGASSAVILFATSVLCDSIQRCPRRSSLRPWHGYRTTSCM